MTFRAFYARDARGSLEGAKNYCLGRPRAPLAHCNFSSLPGVPWNFFSALIVTCVQSYYPIWYSSTTTWPIVDSRWFFNFSIKIFPHANTLSSSTVEPMKQLLGPFVDLAIRSAWEKHTHGELIRSTRPELDHKKLTRLYESSFIKVIDGDAICLYLPDAISRHRAILDDTLRDNRCEPYSSSEYMEFQGTPYDTDLSTVDGVWRDPLDPFQNLIVLDIDLPSAIYWLIPIVSACRDNLFLRRIILRNVDDLFHIPWEFPFRKLDLLLADLPLVHLLVIYPPEDFGQFIAARMPITRHCKRLHLMQPTEESSDWVDYDFDPKEDPVGANSMFSKIEERIIKLTVPRLRVREMRARGVKRKHM